MYGNDVTLLARPMPIEYVLIEVPAAFPKDNQYTFPGGNGDPFPIANREELGEIQVRDMLIAYLRVPSGTYMYINYVKLLESADHWNTHP